MNDTRVVDYKEFIRNNIATIDGSLETEEDIDRLAEIYDGLLLEEKFENIPVSEDSGIVESIEILDAAARMLYMERNRINSNDLNYLEDEVLKR